MHFKFSHWVCWTSWWRNKEGKERFEERQRVRAAAPPAGAAAVVYRKLIRPVRLCLQSVSRRLPAADVRGKRSSGRAAAAAAAAAPVALIRVCVRLKASSFLRKTNIGSFTYVHIHRERTKQIICYLSCSSGKLQSQLHHGKARRSIK